MPFSPMKLNIPIKSEDIEFIGSISMVESDISSTPILQNKTQYIKVFSEYPGVGDYFEAAQKWIDETFYGHIVEKLVANIGDGTDDKTLQVLGVGSGSGEIELMFLNKLLIKFPKIHTCVVEPCANSLTKYQAKIKEHAPDITFDWQNHKFEDFLENQQENHFISACNSLYRVNNLNEALQSLHDMLAPGGILLVTITAEYAGFGKLWRTFPYLRPETSSQTVSQDGSPGTTSPPKHHRNSAHVHEALRQLQLPYYIDEYVCPYKITHCFDEEESEERNQAIDFVTHPIKLRERSKDLFQEVLACIKECSVQRGDDWFFQAKHVCFFITRPT
ncbi:histamine N-methyltransferase-like [Amphiura filiformis]|uniref:histamine N-methyltransferase-like n=1 Tax=Amphiura filiformis TaxID=82378 RepID=UPI003B220591